jgi:hypothetical protein
MVMIWRTLGRAARRGKRRAAHQDLETGDRTLTPAQQFESLAVAR